MNPFNLLINYVIANSRASYYNISGNQEVANTGLLAGMISDNPLISYLLIDNKAKTEGEKFNTPPVSAPIVVDLKPSQPASSGTVINLPTDTKTDTAETPKGTPTKEEPSNVVTIETIEAKIAANNEKLKAEISTDLQNIKADLNKINLEKVESRINALEQNSVEIKNSISEIKAKLEEILKANPAVNDTSTKPTDSNSKQQKTQPK
jgi:hypothetical protein